MNGSADLNGDGTIDATGIQALDIPWHAKRGQAQSGCRALPGAVRQGQAGDRTEHYYCAGWRLVETGDHASEDPYNYANSHVLRQFVYGTQYTLDTLQRPLRGTHAAPAAARPGQVDEPVCYDRNTDPTSDNDCLDSGGSQRYFYGQPLTQAAARRAASRGAAGERRSPDCVKGGDANYRVAAFTLDTAGRARLGQRFAFRAAVWRSLSQGLTDENAAVVERYDYTAYGEATILAGVPTPTPEPTSALLIAAIVLLPRCWRAIASR